MDWKDFDDKSYSSDRILVLKIIDDKKPKSSLGNVDPRVFTGSNRLHATKEVATNLWYLKYESGGLPQVLKQKFTKFSRMLEFANNYFRQRNIEIVEVIDA